MGDWWFDEAYSLQELTIMDMDKHSGVFSEEKVGRAIVHNRLDNILLVSLLGSLNKQTRTISRFCFVIVLLLVLVVIGMYK